MKEGCPRWSWWEGRKEKGRAELLGWVTKIRRRRLCASDVRTSPRAVSGALLVNEIKRTSRWYLFRSRSIIKKRKRG